MEEELIEAVRSEKCLYDVKHTDYMKIKLKDSIWIRIAEALNLKDGNEAKKAWEKLRNNHRDALRRQKNLKPKSGLGAVNIKTWRFQENMAFLIPHMANRSTTTNICEEIQHDDESQAHSVTIENDILENRMDNEESRTGNEESTQLSEPSTTDISTHQAHKRRRHKGNTLNDLLNRSIEEHQQRVANRERARDRLMTNTTNDFTVNNVKNDPLFHFFMSMYETTKRLPPLSQHTIKTNLFSSVSQEESNNLMQHSPRPHSSNTQISDAGSYYSSYTPSPVQEQQQSRDSFPANTQTSQTIITQQNQELNFKEGSDSIFGYSTEPFN